MRRIARYGFLLVMIAALLAQTAFAREAVSSIKLNQVQQRDAELTMYVSMSDSAGNPCTGDYAAEQFSISVDGKALDADSVQRFDPQAQGVHYVFSVDVSRSVTTEMMANVRAGLIQYVNEMGPHDMVSIITFGEVITPIVINNMDRGAIIQAIEGINADEGMTALYKGVIDGVSLAATAGGRSAVIIITDGKNDPTDEMSSYTKDSIYDSVKNAQVPMYCIGLTDDGGVDAASLAELAAVTGGDQFIIPAMEISGSLNRVRTIMQSALVLRATLVNTDNKAGFDEISTFKVGFQPTDGPFVTSNDLQQNINWKNVPVPVVSPSPTPIPQIALVLDETELKCVPGETTMISGAIEVEQGVVSQEMLSVTVNGEPWQISSIMRNGNGYTFRAEGVIFGNTEALEVQAMIQDMGIASRMQRVEVTLPTEAPSATPSPVLSVELDESGRGIMFEAGKTITISGVVNVQGDINPADLKLYVNDSACEMSVMQINRSQYEFAADYVLQDGIPSELSVQVQLNDTAIYSRVQRLYLETPSPTPNPELYFSLNAASIVYTEGEPITVRGNIEILAGVVDPDDLALYVNNVRWDMKMKSLGDGTYGFEAVNTLMDSDITQLDIKVRLQSNSKIVSNSERLLISTPVPTATPSPTPRAVVTPPPTTPPTTPPATPTVAPTAVPVETTFIEGTIEKVTDVVNDLKEKGQFIYVIAAAAALLLIIIAVIVLLIIRSKKNKNEIEPTGSKSFTRDRSEDNENSVTRREGDDSAPTVRKGSDSSGDSDFISDSAAPYRAPRTSGGTVHIGAEDGHTMRIGDEGASGTMRIDDQEESGGTQRIDDEVRFIEIEMKESGGKPTRTLRIECDQELVLGRDGAADVIIDDRTVSSKHMMITYDGAGVYVVDLASTNGTKVNGTAILPREPKQIKTGDSVLIGRTTLTFSFDDSEQR